MSNDETVEEDGGREKGTSVGVRSVYERRNEGRLIITARADFPYKHGDVKTAEARRERVGNRRGANEQAKGESKIPRARGSLSLSLKRERRRKRKIKACSLHYDPIKLI